MWRCTYLLRARGISRPRGLPRWVLNTWIIGSHTKSSVAQMLVDNLALFMGLVLVAFLQLLFSFKVALTLCDSIPFYIR